MLQYIFGPEGSGRIKRKTSQSGRKTPTPSGEEQQRSSSLDRAESSASSIDASERPCRQSRMSVARFSQAARFSIPRLGLNLRNARASCGSGGAAGGPSPPAPTWFTNRADHNTPRIGSMAKNVAARAGTATQSSSLAYNPRSWSGTLALLRPHKLACFVAFPVFLLTAYAGVISAMYHYAVVIKEDERFDFKMPSTPITT